MRSYTKIGGVEISVNDGNVNTSDTEYYDKTYAEEHDQERINWLKKQLRRMGYTGFINSSGDKEL